MNQNAQTQSAYTLGNVPERMISNAKMIVTPYEGKLIELNVASWLQMPGLAELQISLLVSYQDGSQVREVQVDHGKLNALGKVMLSGIARLPMRKSISNVRVQVRSGIELKKVLVEELFVQPVEMAESAKQAQPQLWAAS